MSGPHPVVYFAIILVVLLGAAMIVPDNGLSGMVIREPSCGALGCSELCDVSAAACSEKGMVCCATSWGTGVCDYEQSCEMIAEYSARMSLTQYQDTVRETPGPVGTDWSRFAIPLAVVVAVLIHVVASGRSRKKLLR